MREIKFRAYDIERKKLIYQEDTNGTNEYKDYHFKLSRTNVLLSRLHEKYNIYVGCSAHIMQFTGLKDVNGKDIYEGDIVEYFGFYEHDTAKIVFTDGCFALDNIRYTFATETFFDFFAHETNALIIIGNIYENPELLGE